MTDSIATLARFEKAGKLVRLNMHKNGPRSYQRGIGVLLRVLSKKGGATQYEVIEELGWSRHNLKNVAKKASKKGLVEIVSVDEPRTYMLKLTAQGEEVLAKRVAADKKAADELFSCLSEEEITQLNAITEKLIVAAKADGKITAYGKDYKFHKGHKGHRPHGECK